MAGLEPASSAWQADVAPLDHIPMRNRRDSNPQGRLDPTRLAGERLTIRPRFLMHPRNQQDSNLQGL
jgi:hypothetical protein